MSGVYAMYWGTECKNLQIGWQESHWRQYIQRNHSQYKTLLRIHKVTYSCNSDRARVLDGGQEMCTEFQLETHVGGEA
jgi:hypothetical protein